MSMVEGNYLRLVYARSQWEDARRARAARDDAAEEAQPAPQPAPKPAPAPAAEAKPNPQEQQLRNALTFALWQAQENMEKQMQAVTSKPPENA